MITRRDEPRRVTHYGDAPLVDHAGYTVDVGVEDGTGRMTLRVGLGDSSCHGIRADLDLDAVTELRDRCNTFLNDHQENQ
ncbi:hypothetical protein IU449_26910 [Nocardia higoensis]|uniref:Uncharacterized protein n=1 Tax=Nocardia higoensis TaxID=228599 RepID=A0ABS0DI40_9NOCA|nr:hypothetical protein [Nocardia higoensis]MBF6358131.1 hypothetical protein [Nocardia higoensis]